MPILARLPMLPSLGLVALAVVAASCSTGRSHEERAEHVSISALPAPARSAAEKLVGAGKIEKIDKETEKGRVVYDVEATVDGKHVEYTIAEDGSVLGSEASVAYGELPAEVRAAAEKYFGSSNDLHPSVVHEEGKTLYEIGGKKQGKRVSITLDASGKIVEEEDE